MLTSTTGTKRFPEQQLPDDQRQLIECRLVVGEAAILLELRFAFGGKHVDVGLELASPGLCLPDIPLELRRPRLCLFDRGPEEHGFVGELDQFPAKEEAAEIGHTPETPLTVTC